MLNLSGYQILTQLYESSSSIVYRGIREADNQSVIIKVLQQDNLTSAELTRYQQEYEIIRSLNLDSVVQAYSLETHQNTLAIIFEDFGGSSLRILMDERRFTLAEFLHLALQITDSLGHIHQANIIHKDINPSNIVFNPKTEQLKIIDFGLATRLTHSHLHPNHLNNLEGTLAYISPEQTGRMNRNLDYRTDFYSLGVTFYELLTGQLPFEIQDAMGLVHCHLAKHPQPPSEVNPEIPQPVSDIVMKLLAKNVEERYQNAWGIKADLVVCLMQLEANGIIEDVIPGEHEISDQFQIPQKLYGRERELAILRSWFERVKIGQTKESSRVKKQGNQKEFPTSQSPIEMIMVTGSAGIGKSVLIHEIGQTVQEQQGYFISGQFDPLDHARPYSAIIRAFQKLVQQLLTESEVKIQQWREKFLAALGANGQVMIDLIPELELIIGQQLPVPKLEGRVFENQTDQIFIFYQFIQVFATVEHSLVLFLDDLHWADSATLELIELIITRKVDDRPIFSVPLNLGLIGAYRDNEIYQTHPLIKLINKLNKQGYLITNIALNSLGLEPIIQLLIGTLHSQRSRVQPLAELMLKKTAGNPSRLKNFLTHLYTENVITFDFECLSWQWDMAEVEAIELQENGMDLRIDQLQKSPPS
ncbi:MAG TPA: AAA family ATPase, partial [Stenomitos sp.]